MSNYRFGDRLSAKLDAETLKKMISLKTEYNSILSKNTIKILNQVKQKHFELTDKHHKLLARLYIRSGQRTVLF